MAKRLTRVTLGTRFSEGARLLWQALSERGQTQAEAAGALDTAPSRLLRILYGDNRPDATLMTRMQDLYGVPADEWGREAARKFVPPARKGDSGSLQRSA